MGSPYSRCARDGKLLGKLAFLLADTGDRERVDAVRNEHGSARLYEVVCVTAVKVGVLRRFAFSQSFAFCVRCFTGVSDFSSSKVIGPKAHRYLQLLLRGFRQVRSGSVSSKALKNLDGARAQLRVAPSELIFRTLRLQHVPITLLERFCRIRGGWSA